MKITFVKDHKVKQGDGKGPHYKTGETHDLEWSYADKYKRLGLAVDYVAAAKPAPGPQPALIVETAPAPAPQPEPVAPVMEVNETPAAEPETSGDAPLLAREDNASSGRSGRRRQ